MFKEFVDMHNDKAVSRANQFVEEKKVEVKSFVAFADNLAKTHLIVEFSDAKDDAPAVKKTTAKKSTTAKSTTATK
jgi:hypothetical protein